MKEHNRKCAKCGCSPATDPDTALFRFPISRLKKSSRCESWAKFCFPEKDWSSREFHQQLYNWHIMLCHRHFKPTSFTDWPKSTKKLCRYAVPEESTNTEEQPVFPSESQPGCSSSKKEYKILIDATKSMAQSSQVLKTKCKEKRSVMETQDTVAGPTKIAVNAVAGPSTVMPKAESFEKCLDEKYLLLNAEKKMKEQYKMCRLHMKKICRMRKHIDKLKNEPLLLELYENASVQALINKLTPAFALLLQSQIKIFSRKAKGRRWSQEEKIIALRFFKRSPTCYRLMRRLFCLPAPFTLRSLLRNFDLRVGINKPIFKALRKVVSKQKPSDNEFILMFDEMSIRKNIAYHSNADIIEGYQDHGNQGRSPAVASHALVLMAGGVRKKVKHKVAFYLSSSFVTADRLAVLIKEVLQECFEAGLNISTTALTILGATPESPYFTVDNKEIISMFDSSHLLKCFRNLMMKYNIRCITQIYSNNQSGIGKNR